MIGFTVHVTTHLEKRQKRTEKEIKGTFHWGFPFCHFLFYYSNPLKMQVPYASLRLSPAVEGLSFG